MSSDSLFITIEGCEGTGKSTLISSLYNYLSEEKKRFVVKSFEPGATSFGKEIRNMLLHREDLILSPRSELFLFLADRAHHVDVLIQPALDSGLIVICDRFIDSSIAYQGYARGVIDLDKLEQMCLFATNGLIPDLTFYLDLDPKISMKRIKGEKDRLEKEEIEFHENVRAGYLELAKMHKHRIYQIDASKTKEEVFQEAKTILNQKLSQ
jgi:dTMP kinase